MSVDAVYGLNGSGLASHGRASSVSEASSEPQTHATVSAAGQRPDVAGTAAVAHIAGATGASAASTSKSAQPLLLVPTEPLTPKVLAELIGRQLP